MSNKSQQIYLGKKITFSTVEEQEINSYNYWISLSPEERIAETTKLIQHIYSKDLLNKKKVSRIYFRTIE
ncbi:MAG: hypothetical protein RIA63_05060 [Cyclobacteriaceae bacterium]